MSTWPRPRRSVPRPVSQKSSAEDFSSTIGREPPRPIALVAQREEVDPQGEGDNSDEEAAEPLPPARILTAASNPKSAILAKAAALDPAKLGWKTGPQGKKIARKEPEETSVSRSDDEDAPAKGKGKWVVQLGATEDPDDARDLLARARRSRSLASAHGFTEKVRKDGDTLYRVRFAGLDSTSAEKACRDLKHGGLRCFTTHD